MLARALGCLLLAFAAGAFAQDWPARPLRIVVTFSPGGSSDLVARLIAGPLQEELRQRVIVDNRPGNGGTDGALEVARAKPNGYTLLLSNSAPISISPALLQPAPYHPVKSFTHVSYIGSVPNVFVVHPTLPVRSLAELVAWIKAQPHPVSYGSGGLGSIGQIVGETLKKEHGLSMTHLGYKGSTPMHNDLLAATIRLAIDTLPQNVLLVREGKLRALAVTSASRSAMLPEVPSVSELGHPRLVAENFLGISAPAGLPRPLVERLDGAVKKAVHRPAVERELARMGVTLRNLSPEAFGEFVGAQVREWAQPVKDSGAKLD